MLSDAEGRTWDLTGKPAVSLCRCGASENRPFCDGSHKRIGFQCAATPPPPAEAPSLLRIMHAVASTLLSSFAVLRCWRCGLAAPCRRDAQDLAQYVGQYRSTSDPDQVTAVYLDGGALYEESAQRQRQRLVARCCRAGSVHDRGSAAHLVFLRDAAMRSPGSR